MAFRPHLSMGLALGLIANDLGGPPQAICPKEALYRTFEAFQLHGYLAKQGAVETTVGRITVPLLPQFCTCQQEILAGVERRFYRCPGRGFV